MGDEVIRIFEGRLTPFGAVGIGIAALLVLSLRLALSPEQRRLIRAPLVLLVLHVAFVAARAVLPDPPEDLRKPVEVTGLTLLLLSAGRSGYLLLLHGVLERRRGPGRSLPGIFRDILQVTLYVGIALYVLGRVGVDPASLITTSAVLTAVIGFALQDTLGNVFAGLAIQMQQPFEVGDWIQFDDDSDHIGEVIEINWRATRIVTNTRVEVTVPNNLLAKAPIRNFSKPTRVVRRAVTIIAPHETPPSRIHRLFLSAIAEVPGVRTQPAADVTTLHFGESAVEYRVRFYIEDFDNREVIDGRVRDRLWYALRRAGVPIPSAQRRVTLVEQNSGTAERDHHRRVAEVERALERIPLFEPLSHELVHELAAHTERRLYAPGEVVIQQGDYGQELFVVERGNVQVMIDRHGGMERVATLGPRDFFGEMGLLTGEQRRATIRTESEVELLVVSKEALQPILAEFPSLADAISEVLAERELKLQSSARTEGTGKRGQGGKEERPAELLARIRSFFSL